MHLIVWLLLALGSNAAVANCGYFDQFIDNKNGTVTDPRSGLIWKRCAEGSEFVASQCSPTAKKNNNWYEAMELAKSSRFLSYDDWRLPSITEFQAVIGQRGKCENNITGKGQYAVSKLLGYPVTISNTKHPGSFWSYSPVKEHLLFAWYVGFSDALVSIDERKLGPDFVRLVRDKESKKSVSYREFDTEFANIDAYKKMAKNR